MESIKAGVFLFKGDAWKDDIIKLSSVQISSVEDVLSNSLGSNNKDQEETEEERHELCAEEFQRHIQSIHQEGKNLENNIRLGERIRGALMKIDKMRDFIQNNWTNGILPLAIKRQSIVEQMESLSIHMSYFEMQDIIHMLKNAQPSVVCTEAFSEIYSKIEQGWHFFKEHLTYKDGLLYLKRYEHALSRCIQLIRICIENEIDLVCQEQPPSERGLDPCLILPSEYVSIKEPVEHILGPLISGILRKHIHDIESARHAWMDSEVLYCRRRSALILKWIQNELQNTLKNDTMGLVDLTSSITSMIHSTLEEEERIYWTMFTLSPYNGGDGSNGEHVSHSLHSYFFDPACKLWTDFMQPDITRETDPVVLLQIAQFMASSNGSG